MKRLAGITMPLLDDPRRWVRVASRGAVAVLSVSAGLAVVWALVPLLSRAYFFPAFVAIVLTAVLSGARYGVATALLFALGYAYWFLAPRHALGVKSSHELAALLGYAITGALVAGIGGALRGAHAELQRQHRALSKILHQREDLLRALTHDVRAPLAVITLNADLLARTASHGDPAVRRRAQLIQRSVATVDSMLRDLIDVVALESGQVKLERADVDLGAMLDDLKESLAGALPVERLVILPGTVPPLRADPRRLERVLVNLVSNALKYSQGPVAIAAQQGRGEAIVSVRDEGPGIREEDLPHVFEKYFRCADDQGKEGLGLGLYISRLLVEAHGGRIWAESAPGKGSTFRVALPVAAAAPPAAPEPQGSAA